MEFVPAPAVHRVLCADCGTPIVPNSANLCVNCLRNTVDITEGIPKQASVAFCRNCERFLSPPAQWTLARPESQELLAILLKKLKGLVRVRLTDARFVWTEPHSKRLRVALTIQKEVLTSTILEQVFEIEYLVQHGQCPDCARLAAKNTWKALVQVRQKVPHKRTFLYLEQLILKHGAQRDTISVKEVRDGLDFFYASRSHAIKMVEFLAGVVPIRSKASERLLSSDTHSNTANYKHTYSVEIAPVCKDDLVALPAKLARQLGNIAPLVLATRVGNALHLLDPATLQHAELPAAVFWRAPFEPLASTPELVEFTVLDVEPDRGARGSGTGKWVRADVQVARAGAFRSSGAAAGGAHDDGMMDYETAGARSAIMHARTHLGAILQPGDAVLGYDLGQANFNSDAYAALPADALPDVVLVRKAYPHRRKKHRARAWKLRSIAKEDGEDGETGAARGVVGRVGGRDQKKVEEDYELFLRDLEEDPEMRAGVNMYRAGRDRDRDVGMRDAAAGDKGAKKGPAQGVDVDMDGDGGEQGGAEEEDGGEEDEPDFPEVRLDELLEEFDEMTLREGEGEEVA
ncbi:NMD3 family-domain-containing protein [Vararia minispora EC-137]|uniref:NMD3 family-domain-containing protein n=1 Tax=Vararia minispora EC-137 TaxID=1314806 RepID=A0ACB8QC62_9AGAM|nr:NMD3 family-domain-containing protein [Vararia minispora EC-137]